jgi:hypothetical protein
VALDQPQSLEVGYHLALMRLAPSVIEFPATPLGAIREFTVKARHGNGRPIAGLAPAGPVPGWLELQPTERSEMLVRIRGDRREGDRDEQIRTTVTLRDEVTGLTGSLGLAGQFLSARADVAPRSLRFGTVRRGTTKTLPLRIRNTGRGDLMVKDIVLDHAWLSVDAPAEANPANAELQVRVNTEMMAVGRHVGLVEIESNDRRRQRIGIRVHVNVK